MWDDKRPQTVDRRSFLKLSAIGSVAGLAGCMEGGDSGGGDGNGGGGGGGGNGGGGGGNGGGGNGGGGSSGESYDLKIGFLGPLSGPFSSVGTEMQQGSELAANQINSSDSSVSIEYVSRDSETTPDTAIGRARELVEQENVNAIVGVASSAVAQSVMQYTNQQDVPLVLSGAISASLTGSECNRTTFSAIPDSDFVNDASASVLAEEVIEADSITVAAVAPDYALGQQSWDRFSQVFPEYIDVEFVTELFPQFGQSDYQNEVQEILSTDPDMVVSWQWAGDLVSFIRQGQQSGLFESIDYFANPGGAPLSVTEALGDDMVDMWGYAHYYFGFPDTELNNQYVSQYREEYGNVPRANSNESWAAVKFLEQAILESGGMSPDDMINGLEGLEIEAPGGSKRLRPEDHACVNEYGVIGKTAPVDGIDNFWGLDPIETVAGSDVISPPSDECNL